jgi:hypothetical protein
VRSFHSTPRWKIPRLPQWLSAFNAEALPRHPSSSEAVSKLAAESGKQNAIDICIKNAII